MIRIGKPCVFVVGDEAFLKAKIDISEDTACKYISVSNTVKKVHWRTSENYPPVEWNREDSGLWFSVPIQFKSFLSNGRGDAFVVAMLWYAMITGSDLFSESPVSERLLFHINHFLIPALCNQKSGYRKIRVLGPTTNQPCNNIGGVGTGMSCGVDSFYTMHEYLSEDIPDRYRLSYLTYFNMGAIFHPNRSDDKEYTLNDFYDATEKISIEKCQNAKKVADSIGLPLIYVKTNLDIDYYRGAYGHTGVYRNCAMALSLQGLFSVYYNSSGGWPGYFDLSLTEGSQHYEALLCSCFSTESLSFVLSDYVNRIEKTISISDDFLVQKYLDVCFCFNGCGKCSKCIRTLVTLDIIDKVELFHNVFDIDFFKHNRDNAYFQILKTKDGGEKEDDVVFAKDIYELALQRNKIPRASLRKYRFYLIKKRFVPIKKFLKSLIKKINFFILLFSI